MNTEETLVQIERENLLRKAADLTSNPSATRAQLKEADVLLAQASAMKTRSQMLAKLNKVLAQDGLPQLPALTDEARAEQAENAKRELRSYLTAKSVAEARALEQRTYTPMNEGSATQGGYFVPEVLYPTLFEKLAAADRLFDPNVVTMISTESGQKTSVVVEDDVTASASVIAENGTSTQGPNPTLSVAVLGKAPTYRSGQVLASVELAQDTQYPLDEVLNRSFARRLQRGIGAANVATLIAGATSAVTSASASIVTVDELYDLYEAVDSAYLDSDRCYWLMNRKTLVALLKQKSQLSGNYLIQPRTNAKGELLIAEKPVALCPSFDDIGAGNKPIALGDLSRFVVRTVKNSLRFGFYRELNILSAGSFTYEGFLRANAALADSSAVKYVTCHA